MLVTEKRVSGRAMECVRFFYQFGIAAMLVLVWVFGTEESLGDPDTAVVTLGVLCVVGAGALSFWDSSRISEYESDTCC